MKTISLRYRDVDGNHTFSSHDLRDLFVADRDMLQSYKNVVERVSALTGIAYVPRISAADFVAQMRPANGVIVLAANGIALDATAFV